MTRSSSESEIDRVADDIWRQYLSYLDAMCQKGRDLSRIEEAVRELIQRAKLHLDPKVNSYNLTEGDKLKRSWLATFYDLLGQCLALQGKTDEALACYDTIVVIAPFRGDLLQNWISLLVSGKRRGEIVAAINAHGQTMMKDEGGSAAARILVWCLEDHEVAAGVDAALLKTAIQLTSTEGMGDFKRFLERGTSNT